MTEQRMWQIVFLLGLLGLTLQGLFSRNGLGREYVRPLAQASTVTNDGADSRVRYVSAPRNFPGAQWSPARTAGLWISALLTLCVYSYLYRDNPFYKLAEAVVVGVSAGYAVVVNFWDSIVRTLMVELAPGVTRLWAMPSLPDHRRSDLLFLIPLLLGCCLFFRFTDRWAKLARWPLAFVVGMTAGLKLVSIFEADFLSQIRATILPFVVFTQGQVAVGPSLRNSGLVLCVVCTLCYFLFSFPHRGVIGRLSRLGVWVLMISFGASFGFTVMGRITLLTARLQFLFDDWLWLIDPLGRRV